MIPIDPGILTEWVYPALLVVAMLVGANNAKALAPSIVFALGLSMVYPDVEKARFLSFFYIPAVILANFRD